MTRILILSSPEDPHAKAVHKHLKKMRADVDYFRIDEFIQRCGVTFTLGTKDPVCLIERTKGDLDLRSYSSIWHRRPGSVVAGTFVEDWISTMVEQEARMALDGMFRSLACLWVNFPPYDYECRHKLWQLELAKEIGLEIPETLITNKPALVQEFFEKCNGEVVYKLMSEASSFAIPVTETPAGISTLPLRQKDLPHLDQVAHSPHLFQRCIKKKFDLRVTIVGHEVFTISIDSQAGRSKIDWRNDYSVEMKPYVLPDQTQAKCLALMRRLGLNYGALDLIETEDGDYVFLEINCAGQYLWIEQRTPLQISLAVARLLAGEIDALCPPVSM